MILEKDGFRLYKIKSNYHLIELETNTDHMIDTCDAEEFLNEKEFLSLVDIDAAIEVAWKIIGLPENADLKILFK